MSFSFQFRSTLSVALAIASSEMDKVVEREPVHAHDQANVKAVVEGQLGRLSSQAEGKHVVVLVSGSLGWSGSQQMAAASGQFTANNLSVSTYLVPVDSTDAHLPALREA